MIAALVVLAVVLPARAQERYTNEAMGWSCAISKGWSRVEGTTLETIRSDLKQGPGSADIEACWALRNAGGLPRIVLSVVPGEITSRAEAEVLVRSLSAGSSTENSADQDPTRLSARSGLASFDGEVFVLTEGMVGAHGLVQLVGYTRTEDRDAVEAALLAMIDSAKFERDARVPAAARTPTNRLLDWGVRGAVIGAMVAVVIFGIRMLRAMWAPSKAGG